MGLVTALLTAPLAPVRAVVWVGGLLRDEVDRELYDPTVIRHELQEVDEARAAGRIDAATADERQRELLSRLIRPAE
ncbi:gas vesicle protein GvpG [Dactylosporangium sp. CS-033363]|uniref:gas vesicle protein GvpG n=1 Tax=Dactylosporangium sp. CS-033363 TaxID=3239935 RepID=UPI003D945238